MTLALEIQMRIIGAALAIDMSPTALMLVCWTWHDAVDERLHSAQMAGNLSRDVADSIISHFVKAKSHPLFLCLTRLDSTFSPQEWTYITEFSTAFFHRVTSMGLRGDWSVVQQLICDYGTTLQVQFPLTKSFCLLY